MNKILRISACMTGILIFSIMATTRAQESVPVNVIEASIGPVVDNLPLTGTITSERTASLSSRVSGLVADMKVDSGDRLERGDVLLELDRTLAKLALDRARAALNEARVALKEAERLREEAIDLGKSKNIPQTTVQARIADVEMRAAAVATLSAEYKQQEEVVRRHTVIAPFNGAVSRKLTEVGEWVETGTPVLELVATDQLRLDIQVPQEYFLQIGPDTPVKVTLDAARDEAFEATVKTTVPVNDPDVRTFLARVQLDNTDNRLIPGMSARAMFTLELQDEALTLPRDAIVRHPDGRNSVWIVKKKEDQLIATEQNVRIGRSLADQVIIREGLEPGSTVVIRGNETLNEGQAVHILDTVNAVMK